MHSRNCYHSGIVLRLFNRHHVWGTFVNALLKTIDVLRPPRLDMPVDEAGLHQPALALPPGLLGTEEVWRVRFTGEVFRDYECASCNKCDTVNRTMRGKLGQSQYRMLIACT